MTAKQIRFFGSKRQKAALKASRKRKAKAKHRKRTKPNPSRKRAAAPRKRRAVARRHTGSTRRRKRRARSNPGDIILWTAAGNPGRRKKGKKAMAKRRKRRAVARHHNAGRRRKAVHHRRRRDNPGALGRPMDWIQGGAGVVAGVVGTRTLPQMLLGASNTGAMGYAANAVSALVLGWGAHAIFKKPVLTTAVVAGGFAALISRVISDQTPFGAQFSLSGLGDWGLGLYQKSNYPYPPRVQGGRGPSTSMFTWGDGSQVGLPVATVAAGGADSTSAC